MGGAAPNSEQRTEQINKAKTQTPGRLRILFDCRCLKGGVIDEERA